MLETAKKIQARLATALALIDTVRAWICYALLVVIVCVTATQIFLRFILHSPISWSEEVSLLLLIWFGMIALAGAVYRHGHIAITTLRDALPPRGAACLDTLAQALTFMFGLVLALQGEALIKVVGAQLLPASGIAKVWQYYPVVIGGWLIALNALGTLLTGQIAPPQHRGDEPS